MKFFGRLKGSTPLALTDTAPANTSSPYTVQLAGTKLLARGEGASAAAFNRGLTALQENIESIVDVLDAPALAESRITALVSTHFGVGQLQNTAIGATSLALGGTLPAAVHWVYAGLHKSEIGKFLRAYRYDRFGTTTADLQRGIDVYDQLNPTDALHMNSAVPTDVYNGGASIWGTQLYLTSQNVISPNAIVDSIPPISYIKTALTPYAGAKQQVAIGSWATDGCFLSAVTWQSLYVQPGVFVHIESAGTNNGLYRVAYVSSAATAAKSKAVLSRGGLCKVTLASTTGFTAGQHVSWRSRSADDTTAAAEEARENYAYVMFVESATVLYLSQIGCETDLPGAGQTYGKKVDIDGATIGSTRSMSEYGLLDQESSAQENWNLTTGIRLYRSATNYSVVSAILPPGYPVSFDTTQTGTATPCNPPGFVINPTLVFTAGDITGGQYSVQCKTLSTVRNQLLAQAGVNKIVQNPASRLGYNEFEAGAVRAFARYLKTGDEDFGIRFGGASNPVEYPAGPFTGCNVLLGENLWKITFTATAETLATGFAAIDLGAGVGVYINQPVVFKSPTSLAPTSARVVAVTGDTLVLSDVAVPNRTATHMVSTNGTKPILAGSKIYKSDGATQINAMDHVVATIVYSPAILDATGATYTPAQGLNAAYNNHYAAAKSARGNGLGNQILLFGTGANERPITAVTPDAYAIATGAFRVSSKEVGTACTLLDWVPRSSGTQTINVRATVDGALSFGDINNSSVLLTAVTTGVSFPTNYASSTAVLTPVAHTSILTSLNRLNDEQPVKVPVRVATATTGELNTVTYAVNGGAITLTKTAVGVITIDGVAIVLGDRILVKHTSTGLTSVAFGIYKCTTEGTAGVAAVFTRTTDANSTSKLYPGIQVEVTAGTLNANTIWSLAITGPINSNFTATALTFTQIGGYTPSDATPSFHNGAYASGSSGTSPLWSRSDHTHGGKRGVRLVTAVDSVTTADDVVLCTSAGDYVLTLPAGAAGMHFDIHKIDSVVHTVTITANGADSISQRSLDGTAIVNGATTALTNDRPHYSLVWLSNVWHNISPQVP